MVLIAALGLAATNMWAVSPKTPTTVFLENLVELIPTCGHWETDNLAKIGLTELIIVVEENDVDNEWDEGAWYIVYGNNAKVASRNNYYVTLESTGSHAFAIEVLLTTDNRTTLYFKEKADYDEFLAIAKKSGEYTKEGDYQSLGNCSLDCEGLVDGWYVIRLHC